jgi:hypothetical protein
MSQPQQAGEQQSGKALTSRTRRRSPAKKSKLDARTAARWRDSVFEQIRELMAMQCNLSVYRMCQLGEVSRASFYRSLKQAAPDEEDVYR